MARGSQLVGSKVVWETFEREGEHDGCAATGGCIGPQDVLGDDWGEGKEEGGQEGEGKSERGERGGGRDGAGAEEWKESSEERGMEMGMGAMELTRQDSGFDADGREQNLGLHGQLDLEVGSEGRYRKVVYVGEVEGYDRKTEKHRVRVSNRHEIGRAKVSGSQSSPTVPT